MALKDRIAVAHSRTAVLTLDAEDWQLFTNSMDCAPAAAAINAAIEAAVAAGGGRREARRAAEAVMAKWSSHGADDSEPHGVLADVLDGIFGKA